jgi:hypothetical protein
MSNVYFKFFESRVVDEDYKPHENYFILDIQKVYEKKLWSSYRVQKNIINSIIRKGINIRDKDYVLCPLYGDKEKISDFQFGVTETRKKDESIFDCFKRSIGEELGLRYLKDVAPYGFIETSLKVRDEIRNFKVYTLNINKTDYVVPVETVVEENPAKDDNSLIKSGCVVYGSEEDVLKFLNRDKIVLDKSSDNIIGIVAIKFGESKKYFIKPYDKNHAKKSYSSKRRSKGRSKRGSKVKSRKSRKRRSKK